MKMNLQIESEESAISIGKEIFVKNQNQKLFGLGMTHTEWHRESEESASENFSIRMRIRNYH